MTVPDENTRLLRYYGFETALWLASLVRGLL